MKIKALIGWPYCHIQIKSLIFRVYTGTLADFIVISDWKFFWCCVLPPYFLFCRVWIKISEDLIWTINPFTEWNMGWHEFIHFYYHESWSSSSSLLLFHYMPNLCFCAWLMIILHFIIKLRSHDMTVSIILWRLTRCILSHK